MHLSSPEARRASAEDHRACLAAIRTGSKTFYAASWLLPASVRRPAYGLYAFCRLSDDAVDLGFGSKARKAQADAGVRQFRTGPDGGDDAVHSARRGEGSRIVHDIVADLGGSISAEHGLGAMKTEEARRYKSAIEIAALSAIRQSLDPKRIMNPRVLF